MSKINYNFSGFDTAMSHLKQEAQTKRNVSNTILNEIKTELNKFFKDSSCSNVIFTRNTDKMFFGMTTYAIMDYSQISDIAVGEANNRIKSYIIEIDSKLLEIGLNIRELTAILLHEVGHLVIDSTPSKTTRKAIDTYMAEVNDNINLNSSYRYKGLLAFAIRNTIRKTTSIFTRKDDEIIADEFVFMCGYGEELQSAFDKIVSQNLNINKDVSKLLALQWTLRIYKNIALYRLPAIRQLNKMKAITGSELEKREIDEAIESINSVANDELKHECYIRSDGRFMNEAMIYEGDNKSVLSKIQKRGIRGFEDDIYEYQLRIKNVETEADAMLILRQINSRMAILDDYMTFGDIDTKQMQQCENLYHKYSQLREELTSKTVYNKKNYGIWFDYNQFDNNK